MFVSKIWRGLVCKCRTQAGKYFDSFRFITMASDEKRPRSSIKIGTHSGTFHCDEALACFMLKQLPRYRDAEIVRTRDQKVLDECDIVLDVGGIYDPSNHRYDHHQRTFKETITTIRSDFINVEKDIRLSSAGLIYAHFGLEILKEILFAHKYEVINENLNVIYRTVYNDFIEEIDAIDNGVPICNNELPNYSITTHVSARVGRLNPNWNVENPNHDELFKKAMALVGAEFVEKIIAVTTVWFPARNIVKESIENRYKVSKSGQIIELNKFCPWQKHLLELEKEMGIEGAIKFCIFQDGSGWKVQAIPIEYGSFICRIFIHEKWQGLRDEHLDKISGIEGCIFCHATGFIGGNKTREGALQMALKSIEAVSG